jgi:hypothetical protein
MDRYMASASSFHGAKEWIPESCMVRCISSGHTFHYYLDLVLAAKTVGELIRKTALKKEQPILKISRRTKIHWKSC